MTNDLSALFTQSLIGLLIVRCQISHDADHLPDQFSKMKAQSP
jgi:hypothetical protein